MGTRVVVLGGGVGGLSVAQELAERGFKVEVYERRSGFGGKARSIPVPSSASEGRRPLPGEHGFRFFPSFYKHLPDTMKRIPFASKSVFDNLVDSTRVQIARAGKLAFLEPTQFPQTLDDWLTVFKSLFSNLGIPDDELAFFIDRLLVYPERMKKNLESTGGLIFSGQLLLDLAEAGMLREEAYRLVQSHAMRAWKEDLVFRDEVAKDPAITKLLSPEKLARTFDYERQLGNVGAIFKRVIGE